MIILTIEISVGYSMELDEAQTPGDVVPTSELPNIKIGERLIRIVLVIGFVIVIAIEVWLLFEALRIWM
jgi:hypothetical protein